MTKKGNKMKKIMIAAFAAMVLFDGVVMAANINVNDYIKDGVFDVEGYYKALNGNKNENKLSEHELLLRLVMMKEALKDAKTAEYSGGLEGSVDRAGCGGTAQRLNANYGSYENMNMSQQAIKAGVVNMRQSWGHLCWTSKLQYKYDGWREFNFKKAMWGQAYAMAAAEKMMTKKLKERIFEGEKLDPEYVKKLPLYSQLRILRPLQSPRTDEWVRNQRIILGYAVNSLDEVEENIFENVVDSAMINGEPWRISQFLNHPHDFIADMQKKPAISKYYNYMSAQMEDTELLLNKIKKGFEYQAKIDEEKRIAQAKIDEEKRIAQEKLAEEERRLAEIKYQEELPKLKESVLDLRKNATQLECEVQGRPSLVVDRKQKCSAYYCTHIVEINEVPYIFAFSAEKRLFGGYEVKLSRVFGANSVLPLSKCRSKEERDIYDDLQFGKYKGMARGEFNQMLRELVKTKEFKTIDENWRKSYPVWESKVLSRSEIQNALQQIQNEMNNE